MDTSPRHKGFKDLESWKKGRELRNRISNMVKGFPAIEKYALTLQVLRSSRSITNNIAEGYGRFTYTDTKHFFIQARGSVTETMDHLSIAFDEHYITESLLSELEHLCEDVYRLINGYISYLDRQNGRSS